MVLDEGDLLDEAAVEHASAKELISQIQGGSPDDDRWDAKVTVLGEYTAIVSRDRTAKTDERRAEVGHLTALVRACHFHLLSNRIENRTDADGLLESEPRAYSDRLSPSLHRQ
jgi:hypothetical protein